MSIRMRREQLPRSEWSNPGLFLDKGFEKWEESNGQRGESIGSHLKQVCAIEVSRIYRHAYRRWLGITSDEEHFASWFGRIDGRLFAGLGMPHVLETQVCRHPVYGMPQLPGSGLKGLARAMAERLCMDQEAIEVLFGMSSEDPEKADAGYLTFHDAWWIPEGDEGGSERRPYVNEMVAVHAVEYYQGQGKSGRHPDLDSPNPNHQLAVQGSFYFVVEGLRQWAELGLELLVRALETEGAGGKVAAGYGYFACDEKARRHGQDIASESRAARKKVADQRQAWAEQTKKNLEEEGLSEPQRLVRSLTAALHEHWKNKTLSGKAGEERILSLVNQMLKSEDWSRSDRDMAMGSIEEAYSLVRDKGKRNKKLAKAREWLGRAA